MYTAEGQFYWKYCPTRVCEWSGKDYKNIRAEDMNEAHLYWYENKKY